MKVTRAFAVAALLLAVIGPVRGAAAGTTDATIFVANSYDVTAYPTGSSGDVAPTALTTDMAEPNGIARDAGGRIYVTNSATNTVTVYAANANGNVPPIAVIGGSNTLLLNPSGIALDASGKIYVLNSGEYPGSIAVYPPLGTSTGILNEAPIAAIAGSNTLLDYPTGIAADSLGNIYVANELGGPVVPDKSYDVGMLTVYASGSSGNIAPIATISGAGTGLAYPAGIALDSVGNIYVVNFHTANPANTSTNFKNNPSITIYPAGSNGNAMPTAIIAGDNTGLGDPQGIALDSTRNLYVTGYVSDVGYSVNVYPMGSKGNVSPAATIVGADTGLDGTNGIALDSSGSLYLSNRYGGPTGDGSVTVYPAGSTGDAVPTTTITSNFTGLDAASGIAVDSTGNIYVTNKSRGGSVTVYPAGSYATGPPIATIAGDNTGLFSPLGIAVDSNGNIFVLNDDDAITVYPAGSAGNVTPNATINIDSGGKSVPTGMAVDPGGDLYVTNRAGVKCNRRSCHKTSRASVAVYPAGSDGNAEPSAVIAGPNTKLASPSAIAVDQSGNILVANEGRLKCTDRCGCFPTGHGSVTVYPPGSHGDVVPIATIKGANTGLWSPYGITLDSNGNIYVLNNNVRIFVGGGGVGFCVGVIQGVTDGSDILTFAAGSDGDATPIGGIGGPFTGLAAFSPAGIAIGPAGP